MFGRAGHDQRVQGEAAGLAHKEGIDFHALHGVLMRQCEVGYAEQRIGQGLPIDGRLAAHALKLVAISWIPRYTTRQCFGGLRDLAGALWAHASAGFSGLIGDPVPEGVEAGAEP